MVGWQRLGRFMRLNSSVECFAEAGEKKAEEDDPGENHYKQIFRLKTMWLLAVYLTCYSGIEATLGSEWYFLHWRLAVTSENRLECDVYSRGA
jgi:hypothetical protein